MGNHLLHQESIFLASFIALFSNLILGNGIWTIYQAGAWSIIGCLLLIILFYNSAQFSEEISKDKYPEYENYQKNVPMFFGIWNSNWKK